MLISVGSRSVLHVNMDESTLVHCAGGFLNPGQRDGSSPDIVLVYHGHIDVISHGFSIMADYRCHPISR
jgi:hypothetical protein